MEIYSITSHTLTFLEDILLLFKVGTGRILSIFTSEGVSLWRPAVCPPFVQPLPTVPLHPPGLWEATSAALIQLLVAGVTLVVLKLSS